jgi:hypothetical protein
MLWGQAILWVRLESDQLLRLAARLSKVLPPSALSKALPPSALPRARLPPSPWDAATTGAQPSPSRIETPWRRPQLVIEGGGESERLRVRRRR